MSQPRRRILRSPAIEATTSADERREIARLRARLEQERITLARWTTRLKRTFHAYEKQLACVARLEKRLARSTR